MPANLRVCVVRPSDRARRGELLRAGFALRHRIFVEQKGWEVLRRPDGLDIDAHDRDDAIHILLLDGAAVVGHARLIPGGFLVSCAPDAVAVARIGGGAPVFGLSRFCVDDARLPWVRRNAALAALFMAALGIGCDCGAAWLMFDTDASLILVLRTLGFTLHSLGEPGVMGGRKLYPMMLAVKRSLLADLPERIARWRPLPEAAGVGMAAAG